MPTFIDITGQRFGHLTAVRFISRQSGTSTTSAWLLLCDCGKSVTRQRHTLYRLGHKPSCGCAGHPNRIKHWATSAWYRARRESARRGRQFELSVERFGELMSKPCHYCGGEPSSPQCSCRSSAHKGGLRNGVDRVDSSIGYVDGNCVPCCFNCNRAKSNLPVTDFLAHVSAIHHHQTCSQP